MRLLTIIVLLIFTFAAHATDRRGRLGIGISNQLKNGLDTLSVKFQGSRTFSFETLANLSTADNGGFGVGLKIHRILFDEPQLNFYIATLMALEQQKQNGDSNTGFQTDFTCGSEFHFSGLRSLAFTIDFGISIYKFDDLVVETTGAGMITAGIHFYL